MYLSLLTLDRMEREAVRVSSDVYRLHQFVLSGFQAYEQPGRVLFRVEPESRQGEMRLLVQSISRPAWKDGAFSVNTKEIGPLKIRSGAHYRFRLRANPAVKKDGKRLGLIRDEALEGWLRRKGESIGASFSSVTAIDEGYLTGTRKKDGREDRVNIKTARFEGVLRVDVPALFEKALEDGIGPAKAFGCGLLSLARG